MTPSVGLSLKSSLYLRCALYIRGSALISESASSFNPLAIKERHPLFKEFIVSHLFPVKNYSLFRALEQSGGLRDMPRCDTVIKAPSDGCSRIVLCSPEVLHAARQLTELDVVRVRIAFPLSPLQSDFVGWNRSAKLEIYDVAGTLAREPELLTQVPPAISTAIEVELLVQLLKTKDVHVPMV